MRRVARGPTPSSLDGPMSAGGREYTEAAKVDGVYKFKAYKGTDVVAALLAAFGPKCAYCEAPYGSTQPPDIDHYRPKLGYIGVGGDLCKPGYWWLAANWANLLPTCIDCNRPRNYSVGDKQKIKGGKGNQFPLASEADRATSEGSEAKEAPLLLNPTVDDPAEHLSFENGVVFAREVGGVPSRRGQATIDVCALWRPELTKEREELAKSILVDIEHVMETLADIDRVERVAGLSDQDRADELARLRSRLTRNVELLEEHARPEKPYSAMADQMIRDFRASLQT